MPHLRRIIEILALIAFIVIGTIVVWKMTSSPPPAVALPTTPAASPKPAPPVNPARLTLARFWTELGQGSVQCQLCFRNCTIADGERGYCPARINRKGKLYTLVYGQAGAVQATPVEREPLLHYLPGSSALCLGTASCNLRCTFCQNWQLTSRRPEEVASFFLSPEDAVKKAKEIGCQSMGFTYNEPTICYEWVYDTAKLAKQEGVRTYFHTNGGINPQPLKELLPYMDAVCVDVKGFTAEFFETTSFSRLEPVLETLKIVKQSGVWLEIACLIIPTLNDDMGKIQEMSSWIKENLGDGVPVHFSRYFPAYKLTRLPPTPVQTLEKAREIAIKEGLKYVSITNVPGHVANNTFCPQCGKLVIKRIDFAMIESNLNHGKCKFCGYTLPGIWG